MPAPHHRRPAAPPDAAVDTGTRPDTEPGTPPPANRATRVPMAVWPAIPPVPDLPRPAAVLPPLLADRLIATYTRPGQVVLAAGAGASVAAEAAEQAARRPVLDTAGRPTVFPPLGTRRATLAVITPPAVTTDPARYTRWATTLAPGGILAVLVPAEPGPHTTHPGRIITAAEHAGLGYLQHIIAILARLDGDHLVPAPTPDQHTQVRTARAAGLPVHLPAHSDLLIFQRPPAAEPAATEAAIVTDGQVVEEVSRHAHAA